jgi:hypothetical protein
MKKQITQREYQTAVDVSIQPGLGEWIDKQDVIMLMHISERTLQTWRSKKILPFARIRGKIYYNKEDVMKLLRDSIEL